MTEYLNSIPGGGDPLAEPVDVTNWAYRETRRRLDDGQRLPEDQPGGGPKPEGYASPAEYDAHFGERLAAYTAATDEPTATGPAAHREPTTPDSGGNHISGSQSVGQEQAFGNRRSAAPAGSRLSSLRQGLRATREAAADFGNSVLGGGSGTPASQSEPLHHDWHDWV